MTPESPRPGAAVGYGRVHIAVRHLQREARTLIQTMAQRDLDDGAEQGELACGGDGRVQRVEADSLVQRGRRIEADGRDAHLLGDEVPFADAVLALGVEHDHLTVAEAELAQHVRLFQR